MYRKLLNLNSRISVTCKMWVRRWYPRRSLQADRQTDAHTYWQEEVTSSTFART